MEAKKRRMRLVNCYLCGGLLHEDAARRQAKAQGGDALLWCTPCFKKTFFKKPKLIRRPRELSYGHWPKNTCAS